MSDWVEVKRIKKPFLRTVNDSTTQINVQGDETQLFIGMSSFNFDEVATIKNELIKKNENLYEIDSTSSQYVHTVMDSSQFIKNGVVNIVNNLKGVNIDNIQLDTVKLIFTLIPSHFGDVYFNDESDFKVNLKVNGVSQYVFWWSLKGLITINRDSGTEAGWSLINRGEFKIHSGFQGFDGGSHDFKNLGITLRDDFEIEWEAPYPFSFGTKLDYGELKTKKNNVVVFGFIK